MEIIRLPEGQRAPKESDCISVEAAADGSFMLNTSALCACAEAEEGESASVIGGDPYATYEEAEAAGLAIAAEQCVETVYISRLNAAQAAAQVD